jgi:phage terminase large subunit GpA-like protein
MAEIVMPAETLDGLPPFANPEEIFARASLVLRPRRRMKVSEAAERYRFIFSGGQVGMWRNSTAPYMVEPMDTTTARDKSGVIFVGPSRASKTAGMVINKIVHKVVCDPGDGLIVHTDKESARLFSLRDLELMNQHCPEVRARLSANRNEDNIFDKRYRGMILVIGHPTINHLSAKDYEFVLLTDYDRMPDDVDGEGSPFVLAMKRTQTYGSRGMAVAESSPGRDVQIDPDKPWTKSGHEAPPCGGILALFNQGDRRLWYWPCLDCGEYFTASFSDLTWPKNDDGSPRGGILAAAEKASLVCPACSSWSMQDRHKRELNARGRWLREGQSIDPDGQISGAGREAALASFWLKGPAAAFQSWSEMVANELEALAEFERSGETLPLKTRRNTDQGEPFWTPRAPGTEVLDPDQLKARKDAGWKLGTVPAGVRALVVTVDVQGRYFDVQVTGFGVDFESWIVHREQISQSAEEGRLLDPGSYPEDWALLWPLLERGWPLADDPTREMTALCMAVDSGGAAGVTGNAYRFAATARQRGISDQRLILLKGAAVGAKRFALTKVDWQLDGKILAHGLRLLLISTNEIKDDVAGALRRETPGPDYVHLPGDLNDEWFVQATAEERDPKGKWAKRSSGLRNEAFDHMCYARAAVLRPLWRWDRINWGSPPPWAQPHATSSKVRKIEERPSPTDPNAPAPKRRSGSLAKFKKLNTPR